MIVLKDKHDHNGHGVETFMVPDTSVYTRPALIPNQRLRKLYDNNKILDR